MGGRGKERVIIPKADSVYIADDGTASVVLEDEFDPNYKPPEAQILDYANWLGMDTSTEQQLLWIAEEGLKTPLPENWRPCKVDSDDIYYFNFQTGESIWDHPLDEKFKALYRRENKKRLDGRPFKKAPDDETYEFIHGHPPKKEKKKKDKGEKGSLPEPLTKALSQAAEKNDTKNAGMLNKGGPGALKKNKFGSGLPMPMSIGDDPVSASALGRTALPGLRKGSDLDNTPAPLTMKGLKNAQGTISGGILAKPEKTVQESGPDPEVLKQVEAELKREIERIREEYLELEEEERRIHDNQKRRMKFEHEKQIEDLEMQMESSKNTARRSSTAKQNEWESELDDRRRKYEQELNEKYNAWKDNQQQLQDQKLEQLEFDKQRKIKELTSSKEERLQSIKKQSESKDQELQELRQKNQQEIEELRSQQEAIIAEARKKTDSEKQKLEAELSSQIQSLKETHEAEAKQAAEASEKQQQEMKLEKENLEANLASKNRDLQELTAQLKRERNLAEETRPSSSASFLSDQLEEDIAATKAKHEEQKAKIKLLETRQSELLAKCTDLESTLSTKTAMLEDLKSEMQRQQELLATRQNTNMSLSEQLESEIRNLQKAAEDKSRLLESELQSKRENMVKKIADLEKETKQKEDALNNEIKEAENSHKKQLEDLQKSITLEGEQKLDEIIKRHKEKISAERKRLEDETETHILKYAAESARLIEQRRGEEEARIAAEIQQLQNATLAQKQSHLESSSNNRMMEVRQATEAKIDSLRRQQNEDLQQAVKQQQEQAKELEIKEREKVEGEMKERLAEFQKMEQEKLDIALKSASEAAKSSIAEVERRLADEIERNTASQKRLEDLTKANPTTAKAEPTDTKLRRAPPPVLEKPSPTPSDNESDAILRPYLQRVEKEQLKSRSKTRRPDARPFRDYSGHAYDQEALRHAKQYIRRQKRELKARQEKLQELRRQWDADVDNLRGSESQAEGISVLRRARLKLDKKAQELNAEVKNLHNREYWLIQRASKMRSVIDSDYDSSLSEITIPEKPSSRNRPHRDYRGEIIRGGDPRVLNVLSSLSSKVSSLQRKLSKMEDSRRGYSSYPDSIDRWSTPVPEDVFKE